MKLGAQFDLSATTTSPQISAKCLKRSLVARCNDLLCILLFSFLISIAARAEETVSLDFGKFLELLLGSTKDDGRFDFERHFSCGKPNSEEIVTCTDTGSGVEFQFRRQPNVDVINIEIIAGKSADHDSMQELVDGRVRIGDRRDFAALRSQFSELQKSAESGDRNCDLDLATQLSDSDHTQTFSLRNPSLDSAIVLLFPDSEYENVESPEPLDLDSSSKTVGSIIIANALSTPCGR